MRTIGRERRRQKHVAPAAGNDAPLDVHRTRQLIEISTSASEMAASLPVIFGPFLGYQGVQNGDWRASILLFVNDAMFTGMGTPRITFRVFDENEEDTTSIWIQGPSMNLSSFLSAELEGSKNADAVREACEQGEVELGTFLGYRILRYNISIEMKSISRQVEYTISGLHASAHASMCSIGRELFDFAQTTFTMHIQGREEPWHNAIYSCNGFEPKTKQTEEKYDGIRPMWVRLLNIHARRPFHVLFGVGDQIYQDAMWFDCPTLKRWLDIPDHEEREEIEATDALQEEVVKYMFFHYLAHFSQPILREVLGNIPQINICDDHDIFDGCGSYPTSLQNCAVFKTIGRIAQSFFLLFQCHTTHTLAEADGYIKAPDGSAYHFLKLFGSSTYVLGLDTRSERSKSQILSEVSWNIVFQELDDLLDGNDEENDGTAAQEQERRPKCTHLVVAVGVPLTYPRLPTVERLLDLLSRSRRLGAVQSVFRRSGLYKTLGFAFGEPQVLDDLVDHFDSAYHIHERDRLLEKLQDVSLRYGVRVTILAGDVHAGSVGRFRTVLSRGHGRTPEVFDHRLMYQITTSAIANEPPPKAVRRLFNWAARKYVVSWPRSVVSLSGSEGGIWHRNKHIETDVQLREELLDLFRRDVDGRRCWRGRRRILSRRNFCEMIETLREDLGITPSLGDSTIIVKGESSDGIEPQCALRRPRGDGSTCAVFRLHFEPRGEAARSLILGDRSDGVSHAAVYDIDVPTLCTRLL
ncbi:hypothetical protein BJ742DRAFT_859147 [Cladochytrium replicatum]|nr:hypothetical protein BJ742DRAFT_859147 [Cladochytrium replicatum]